MMTLNPLHPLYLSRRHFLAAAAAAGTLSFPFSQALAQKVVSSKKKRYSIASPEGKQQLEKYKKAISKMLALPPSDLRNWYRYALVHTIDCPHGNWWFLVWHRAYLGWFEQICREMINDDAFALPFWDWTPSGQESTKIPEIMYTGALSPTHEEYIADFPTFKSQFTEAVKTIWPSAQENDPDKRAMLLQLYLRGLRFPEDLWFDIHGSPFGIMFANRADARPLAQGESFDETTQKAVAQDTIRRALSPTNFISFGSPKTRFHSGLTGFSLLEGSPHNMVHNCIGGVFKNLPMEKLGFMQDNMSPVDPIFFLHHANIDRLWDIWTRRQEKCGFPTLPSDARPSPNVKSDRELWAEEPFLFFIDKDGQRISGEKAKAGAYATIGDFNYEYVGGFGQDIVDAPCEGEAQPRVSRVIGGAEILNSAVSGAGPAGGTVTLAQPLERSADAQNLTARVTVALAPEAHATPFRVVVNAPGDPAAASLESPHVVGIFSMFGHHQMSGTTTFVVPLQEAVLPEGDRSLTIHLVPMEEAAPHGPQRHATDVSATLLSITLETH